MDVVILLSHSGMLRDDNDAFFGPDIDMARAVPEIDVIVGGHSHTPYTEPAYVEGRAIVHAGAKAQFLGELVLEIDGGVRVSRYTLYPIDDRVLGDPGVIAFIDGVQARVEADVLGRWGYGFDQPIAEIDRDLTRRLDDHVLGNLVTDGLRLAADAEIAVTANGTIRDEMLHGRTGVQSVSDVFRIQSLGIGSIDDSHGYAVMKFWLTGSDLKNLMEFLLVGYRMKGPIFYPRLSGVQVVYNNRRVLFDRVVEIRVGDDMDGYETVSLADDVLFSVATTSYVASFIPTVKKTTFHLLDVTPRDADGETVTNMDTMLVDADPTTPGLQELKSWRVLLEHVSAFPDNDGNGLADIPTTGAAAASRLLQRNSWRPSLLFANATWRMGSVTALSLGLLFALLGGIGWIWRRRQRRVATDPIIGPRETGV